MSSKRKTRLKSRTFSYKERGRLSQRKDLDVVYVTHQKTDGKKRKPIWVEACADSSYDILQQETLASYSPQKRTKFNLQELGGIPEGLDRELEGDFTQFVRRQTKVCLSNKRETNCLLG
jgi:hypothetical protein